MKTLRLSILTALAISLAAPSFAADPEPLFAVMQVAGLTRNKIITDMKASAAAKGLRIPGKPLDLLRAIARQIMVAVVVPPLIFRPDGRGLHDIAAGTATVTLETYRVSLRHLTP